MPVKRALFLILVAASMLVALPIWADDATPAPHVPPGSDQFNLRRFQGNGYSLLIPTDATTTQLDPATWQILGPVIDVQRNFFGLIVRDNAYRLTITVEDNPADLAAYDFGLQAITRSYMDDVPTRAAPIVGAKNGKLDLVGIYNDHLAGLPAAQVRYFTADFDRLTLFVIHDRHAYEFTYQTQIADRQPVAVLQQNIYALMLGSLQFDQP